MNHIINVNVMREIMRINRSGYSIPIYSVPAVSLGGLLRWKIASHRQCVNTTIRGMEK